MLRKLVFGFQCGLRAPSAKGAADDFLRGILLPAITALATYLVVLRWPSPLVYEVLFAACLLIDLVTASFFQSGHVLDRMLNGVRLVLVVQILMHSLAVPFGFFLLLSIALAATLLLAMGCLLRGRGSRTGLGIVAAVACAFWLLGIGMMIRFEAAPSPVPMTKEIAFFVLYAGFVLCQLALYILRPQPRAL